MTTSEQLLREFDYEFPATRKFLALTPDDKLTWKPHEKSMELGRLAWLRSTRDNGGAVQQDLSRGRDNQSTNADAPDEER